MSFTEVEPTAQVDKDAQIAALKEELNALRGRRNLPTPEAPHVLHVVKNEDLTVTDKDNNYVHPLTVIANQYGTDADILYAHNGITLEANARARGFPDSEGGRLIWPGTVLRVPV